MSPSMYFLEMQERKMLGSEVCTTICICIDQFAGSYDVLEVYDVLGIKITKLWERIFMHRKIFMG